MKYRLNKGFVSQIIGERLMIFDGERSTLYTLNKSAAFIFKKLKRGWSEEKIINQLIKKYQISKEKAVKDVAEFLDDLKKKKIVSFGPPKR